MNYCYFVLLMHDKCANTSNLEGLSLRSQVLWLCRLKRISNGVKSSLKSDLDAVTQHWFSVPWPAGVMCLACCSRCVHDWNVSEQQVGVRRV